MSDRRTKNVNIFEDTRDWIKSNHALKEAVAASVNKQKLYLEAEAVKIPEDPGKSCGTVVRFRFCGLHAVNAQISKKLKSSIIALLWNSRSVNDPE